MIGTYRARLAIRAVRMSWLKTKALRNVRRFPNVRNKASHNLKAPLSITLTSYPLRFPYLARTLRSLIDQTVAADRIILWVAREDKILLPADVLELQSYGLLIETCEDIRSYKKLIPALHSFAEDYLVTADDDVYYPPEWLNSLVSVAIKSPRAIVGGRVHMAEFNTDGSLKPYAQWELDTDKRHPPTHRHAMFPTGVGGVLYPPGAFQDEVFDKETFMQTCPRGDDIWFFWMARRCGVQHLRARDRFDVIEWPSTQDSALCNDNFLRNGNDVQIRAIEAHYGFLEGTT